MERDDVPSGEDGSQRRGSERGGGETGLYSEAEHWPDSMTTPVLGYGIQDQFDAHVLDHWPFWRLIAAACFWQLVYPKR
jgi:hypothetical protein